MSNGTVHPAPVHPALVVGTTVLALLANLAGLLIGVTVVLPHLLYIPIALAPRTHADPPSGCAHGCRAIRTIQFWDQ